MRFLIHNFKIMALDSSTDCYFKLNGTREQTNKSLEKNSSTTEMTKNNLNFYESMYHFKKMFPKFDSDVIETVLRANNGSVDRTIDQLLTMAADNDIFETTIDSSYINNNNNNNNSNCNQLVNYDTSGLDLPPSYESIVTSQITSNITTNSNSSNNYAASNQTVQITSINKTQTKTEIFKNETIVEDLICLNQSTVSSVNNPLKMSNATVEISNLEAKYDDLIKKQSDSIKKDDVKLKIVEPSKAHTKSSLRSRHSNILIGELSRDFLRITLTVEQVKKFKSSIKKAKRNEINAMLKNVIFIIY